MTLEDLPPVEPTIRTVRHLAVRLGVSRQRIYNLIKAGKLPAPVKSGPEDVMGWGPLMFDGITQQYLKSKQDHEALQAMKKAMKLRKLVVKRAAIDQKILRIGGKSGGVIQ